MEHLTIMMDPDPEVVQLATIGLPGPKLRYKDLTENDKEDLRQGIYEAIDVQVEAAENAREGSEDARDVSLQTLDNIQNNLLPATTKLFRDSEAAKEGAEGARDDAKAAQQQATLQAQASATSAQQSRNAKNTTETARDAAVSARNAAKVSENNANTSETKASQYATNAKTSENNASSSASTASSKAASATTSETNAKASEVSAKDSEASATQAKQGAKSAMSKAKTSEANAKTSENAAKASEDAAEASENAAEASKDAAATSESNASSSEAAASLSESNAKTSETHAKTSETHAKTSETNAAQSAADAAQTLTSIEEVFNTFDTRYLGPKPSDPTTDNNGDPLVAGAVYWNTNLQALRFYNGNSWEDPAASAAQSASDALSSKQAAASSASKAATSAGESSASASQSAASAGQSQRFRNEAQGFRDTTSTKANAASQSATRAAQSATQASTHADKAKDYRDEALNIISVNAITHIEDAKGVLHAGSTVKVDSGFVDAVSKSNGGAFDKLVTFDQGIRLGSLGKIKTAGGYDAISIGNSKVALGDTSLNTVIKADRNPTVQVGTQGVREIYHEGHKPTPSEIGAHASNWTPRFEQIRDLPGTLVFTNQSNTFTTHQNIIGQLRVGETDDGKYNHWFQGVNSGATYRTDNPNFWRMYGPNGTFLHANHSNNRLDTISYSLYEKGERVYSPNNKPSASDVGLGNLSQGQFNELKITSNHGLVRVGALNSDYCHFRTDLPMFYFGKNVTVEGDVGLYKRKGTKLDSSSGNIYEHGKRVYSPYNKPSAADVGALPAGGKAKNASKLNGRSDYYHPDKKPSAADVGAEPALSPEQKRNIYLNSGAPDAAIGSNGDLYIET